MSKKVLVTGASGFIAQQLILDLLEAGHDVRGTIRSLSRSDQVKATLAEHHPRGAGIELVAADLESDDGWDAAVRGVDVIHHVASPFPLATPRDPMELIGPAREGALRMLRAAKQAGVSRVILTSSCAAICYGYSRGEQPALCTESDWTDDDDLEDTTPYVRSKTIAERAAWDFARAHDMQLTTINPVAVFGPIRSADVRTSVGIVGQMLRGEFPALPRAGIQIVDVRDVAAAHVAAMDRDETIGERYILADGFFTLREVAELLRAELPRYDAKLAKRDMPDFLVRLLALLSADMKTIAKEVGKRRMADGSKVKSILGRELTPGRDALLASAETLIHYGAV